MGHTLSARTCRLLDIQGFEHVERRRLAEVAPWLRLSFGLCALIAFIGTVTASPLVLLGLAPIAAIGAALPIHPFDLVYNHGFRHFTGTGPLPARGAPSRFACGVAMVWLLTTAWAFTVGHTLLGYVLGGLLVTLATLVTTTNVCVPSMLYRALFGWPEAREPASTAPV